MRMDLEDRERRRRMASVSESGTGPYAWGFLLIAGVSLTVALCRALQWSPKVLWPLAFGNLLSWVGTEGLRLRDEMRRRLAEIDMEPSGVVEKLWRETRRRYWRLAVAHAVSALFVAAYYGARLVRGLTLAGQGLLAGTVTSLLILLGAFAYWRSCR